MCPKMEKIRRGQRGRRSKFDDAFKRKVVLEFHNSTDTITTVARRHKIGNTTLTAWITWYERDQERLLTLGLMEADNASSTGTHAEQGNEVEASELKALREELRLAKVKLACLETLIDLTEKDLGVDIRKKAGTRSSEE